MPSRNSQQATLATVPAVQNLGRVAGAQQVCKPHGQRAWACLGRKSSMPVHLSWGLLEAGMQAALLQLPTVRVAAAGSSSGAAAVKGVRPCCLLPCSYFPSLLQAEYV